MSTFDEHSVGTNSRLNPGVPDVFLAAENKRKKAKVIPDCNLAVIPFKVVSFCSPFLSREHVLPRRDLDFLVCIKMTFNFKFKFGEEDKGCITSHDPDLMCRISFGVSYANFLTLLAFFALTQITLLFSS